MSKNDHDSELSPPDDAELLGYRIPEKELDPKFFQQIPNILINDVARKELKAIDVVVYAVLKKHQGQHVCCWVGNRQVARLCGVSNATVRRSIKSLVRRGHIRRTGCDSGITAKTYFNTTIAGGRAIVGAVPPLPANSAVRLTPIVPNIEASEELVEQSMKKQGGNVPQDMVVQIDDAPPEIIEGEPIL